MHPTKIFTTSEQPSLAASWMGVHLLRCGRQLGVLVPALRDKTTSKCPLFNKRKYLLHMLSLGLVMYSGIRNPENPRGTSPKVWSLNPTQPWKAEPEPTSTPANPKFYLKKPLKPKNLRGTSLKCWSPNPTQTRKADPEPGPEFCSPNTSLPRIRSIICFFFEIIYFNNWFWCIISNRTIIPNLIEFLWQIAKHFNWGKYNTEYINGLSKSQILNPELNLKWMK